MIIHGQVLNRILKMLDDCKKEYLTHSNLSDEEFKIIADKSLWLKYMHSLRNNEDMNTFIKTTDAKEIQEVLHKYEDSIQNN